MIIIRELAPSMFVVQCPIRGTFHKTAANRQQARQLVWEAASAEQSRWLDKKQLHQVLVKLGLEADTAIAL